MFLADHLLYLSFVIQSRFIVVIIEEEIIFGWLIEAAQYFLIIETVLELAAGYPLRSAFNNQKFSAFRYVGFWFIDERFREFVIGKRTRRTNNGALKSAVIRYVQFFTMAI